MTVVDPPYLLDFASCTFDFKPDWPEHVWEHFYQQIDEEFEHHRERAYVIHNLLWRRFGIFHTDLSPRNLYFGEDNDLPR